MAQPPNRPPQQDPEIIRQWMSQNLMISASSNGSAPYPQIDPNLLALASGGGLPVIPF